MTEKKLSIIRSLDAQVYFESSHAFIQGFGWLIAKKIPPSNIGVIILRRNPKEVVESYISLNTSPFNYRNVWLLLPSRFNVEPAPGVQILGINVTFLFCYFLYRALWKLHKIARKINLARIYGGAFQGILPGFICNYEKKYLYWYCDETYRLGHKFLERNPLISHFNIDSSELNDRAKILEMFSFFGLSANSGLFELIGAPSNVRADEKAKIKDIRGC